MSGLPAGLVAATLAAVLAGPLAAPVAGAEAAGAEPADRHARRLDPQLPVVARDPREHVVRLLLRERVARLRCDRLMHVAGQRKVARPDARREPTA